MTRAVALVAVVVVGLPGVADAQRADFSGTWIAVKDAPSGIAAAPSPILGERFELRHEGNALTMRRPSGESTIEAAYEIGGPETRVTVPGRSCHGDGQFIETAAWEGDALALSILGSVPPGGGPTLKLNVKRLLRREGADTLVVAGNMNQAGKPREVASVYQRSPEPLPRVETAAIVTKAPATIAQAAWIAGTWIGTTTSTVEERWTPPIGGSMQGMARTYNNSRMSSFEFLCITERDGSLVYVAMPDGRGPTNFFLTSVSSESATFENPGHDYPKRIRYAKLADGSLETTIGGTEKQRTITVVLKRQP